MKTTLWKTLMLLTLVCTLLFSATALGQARYPTPGDVVTDDANVLSQTMARDIADYERFLRDHLLQRPHVQEAHSHIAMSVVKRTTELPLD